MSEEYDNIPICFEVLLFLFFSESPISRRTDPMTPLKPSDKNVTYTYITYRYIEAFCRTHLNDEGSKHNDTYKVKYIACIYIIYYDITAWMAHTFQ